MLIPSDHPNGRTRIVSPIGWLDSISHGIDLVPGASLTKILQVEWGKWEPDGVPMCIFFFGFGSWTKKTETSDDVITSSPLRPLKFHQHVSVPRLIADSAFLSWNETSGKARMLAAMTYMPVLSVPIYGIAIASPKHNHSVGAFFIREETSSSLFLFALFRKQVDEEEFGNMRPVLLPDSTWL